ncbi:hypothetical protein GF377_01895, partial [candidate division GN15 bacterium]|nr:hypothetical protein [candidate division GN15 bacterium]
GSTGHKPPILVAIGGDEHFAQLLPSRRSDDDHFANLHAINYVARACERDVIENSLIETIARQIHADYLARQPFSALSADGSSTARVWESLSEDHKESNRHAASLLTETLRAGGFDIRKRVDLQKPPATFSEGQLEMMARVEHERWRKHKEQQGYVRGQRNDEGNPPTHPYLIDWVDLPPEAKQQNIDMVRGFPRMLAAAGLQVEPKSANNAGK